MLRHEELLALGVPLITSRSSLAVLSWSLVPRNNGSASVTQMIGLPLNRFALLFGIAGGLQTSGRFDLLVRIAQIWLVLVRTNSHRLRL